MIHNVSKVSYNIKPTDFSPSINELTYTINENIEIPPFISHSLKNYLTQCKEELGKKSQQWDTYKRFTNPYEYIHTMCTGINKSVTKYNPLSRAFYKLIELVNTYNILDTYTYHPINTLHLAEGPGGFIEAMNFMRGCEKDVYTGITLTNSTEKNIPSWNALKRKMKGNPRVNTDNMISGDGDLYKWENLEYVISKYGGSMDIITGDGGFDFSLDYNSQEHNSMKLMISQIIFALVSQKNGGTFILKMFDIFKRVSVECVYILSCFYEDVSICKPRTSRIANSEKYIVCSGFKGICVSNYIESFKNIFYMMNASNLNLCMGKAPPPGFEDCEFTFSYLGNLLNIEMPLSFINRISEINSILVQQQVTNINDTITLIRQNMDKSFKNKLQRENLIKCIHWCNEHNIPCISISEVTGKSKKNDFKGHSTGNSFKRNTVIENTFTGKR